MNTKQLWNALTHNPITNFYFDGIFSSESSAFVKEPELIICNTDPSNKAGEHWVLFFVRGKSVDFYDSLGRDINYYGSLFLDFIKNFAHDYKQCLRRTQPIDSNLCGHYCLYYALAKCNGHPMETITDSMVSSDHVIDVVNKNFYIGPSNNCPLLQGCIEC